ncbi:hypothetical protein EVAR_43853_1 [Eumeta japonica]|uniref:Uncharacterized protein n=1 Tax=Eumeta variegata TaxID=151549 RepID=A0A4C1X151_EUMVA|nr:hypothetical protein EVAR_43853_1 [Eumeta japonica]
MAFQRRPAPAPRAATPAKATATFTAHRFGDTGRGGSPFVSAVPTHLEHLVTSYLRFQLYLCCLCAFLEELFHLMLNTQHQLLLIQEPVVSRAPWFCRFLPTVLLSIEVVSFSCMHNNHDNSLRTSDDSNRRVAKRVRA